MTDETAVGEVDAGKTPREVEQSPRAVVKRWLAELDMAHAAEREWREEAVKLWDLYEGKVKKSDAFNILWSNTETLWPALYNSTPNPDVRRRFKDADPLGKHLSRVIERALSYQMDAQDFDEQIKRATLDQLVCGRGVVRVAYQPTFAPAADSSPVPSPPSPSSAQPVVDERVEVVHVAWDKFRRGPGKCWDEVRWVAFAHDLSRDAAAEKFGDEIAGKLTFSEAESDRKRDKQDRAVFATTEVWEIWDRDERRVLFISSGYKDQPCLVLPDPLELQGFFPVPRPLIAVTTTRSLVPIPLYRQYAEQAKELDRISQRINVVTRALKVRGAYSANMPELKGIIEADDREMTPIANVSELASIGGLEKAIWIMPVDRLIQVLQGLYVAREQCKQTIYEIGGISDIVRGASNPNETLGAQQIKTQWGSLRLRRMQRDVQRMIRDALRLAGEVICQSFSVETLAQQTGIQLPRAAQKQQAQQMAMQAQQMGQEPPPEVAQIMGLPAWEEIEQIMRSDALRNYRVDMESDSTVADSLDPEFEGITSITRAIGEVMSIAGPAVQQGMLPIEVPKEISLALVRRARMGVAIEDAIEKIEAPQQQSPTEQEMQAIQGAQETLVRAASQVGQQVQRTAQESGMAAVQQGGEHIQQQLAELNARIDALTRALVGPQETQFSRGMNA